MPLAKLDGMIEDDMSSTATRPATIRWPPERYDELRNEVIDLVLELRKR
jgi:hypothetical protein